MPAEVLRPLVSPSLDIDTFEGRAFVGLVAFDIPELRPVKALPPPPTAGRFLETNVRTYVKHDGQPGVWFFSLDAASTLAVAGRARQFRAAVFPGRTCAGSATAIASTTTASGAGRRRARRRSIWNTRSAAAHGPPRPGTLEHFLVERYHLFARHPLLGLVEGEVRHQPYPLRRARVHHLEQSLLAAAGIATVGERTPDWFSDGVDVDIFPPRRLGKRR